MFQPLAHLVLSASTTGVSRSLSSAAMWDAHLRDVVTRARESWLLQRQPLRLSFSCSAWFGQVAAGNDQLSFSCSLGRLQQANNDQ
jgi:hypothetical protein